MSINKIQIDYEVTHTPDYKNLLDTTNFKLSERILNNKLKV